MGSPFRRSRSHAHGFDGVANRDVHGQLLEHRRHDMMGPYLVLPRRLLPHGAAYGHGADAPIPGRPPKP